MAYVPCRVWIAVAQSLVWRLQPVVPLSQPPSLRSGAERAPAHLQKATHRGTVTTARASAFRGAFVPAFCASTFLTSLRFIIQSSRESISAGDHGPRVLRLFNCEGAQFRCLVNHRKILLLSTRISCYFVSLRVALQFCLSGPDHDTIAIHWASQLLLTRPDAGPLTWGVERADGAGGGARLQDGEVDDGPLDEVGAVDGDHVPGPELHAHQRARHAPHHHGQLRVRVRPFRRRVHQRNGISVLRPVLGDVLLNGDVVGNGDVLVRTLDDPAAC